MQPTKLDYCIASFGRSRRYPISLPLGHLPTSPSGFQNQCQLLPHIPIGSHGIMVVRARRGVHRQAYRPAPDSAAVARPQYREVTKLFAALRMGISELEVFYSGLDFAIASEARFFPHITSFVTDTGRKVRFCYEQYADPDPESIKAVFVANTQDGRKIVVKFAEAYNEEAHSLLVTEGLAPPLLYCDRPAFSDFTMVVMDYVDGKQLALCSAI